MTTSNDITAILVKKLVSGNKPHAISMLPEKCARNEAFEKPTLANRPVQPPSGWVNF